MTLLLQTAAPVPQRVRAAYAYFSQTMDTETIVLGGIVLVVVLIALYFWAKLYLSWLKQKHGYSDAFMKKRKDFD